MNIDNLSVSSFTLTPVERPMSIIFTGLGEIAPTDDITPKEAVQLVMMLACVNAGSRDIDFVGFAKSQGLERHFKAPRI